MGESAEHRIELERTAKYDRLGVLKSLLLLESAMDRKRLVGMDQYLPCWTASPRTKATCTRRGRGRRRSPRPFATRNHEMAGAAQRVGPGMPGPYNTPS